jgi:hypothetical protein
MTKQRIDIGDLELDAARNLDEDEVRKITGGGTLFIEQSSTIPAETGYEPIVFRKRIDKSSPLIS